MAVAWLFNQGGSFFTPSQDEEKPGLALDRAKFTTIQGDYFVAFQGTDNRTELSLKPFLKRDLNLIDGALNLEANGIQSVEVEAMPRGEGTPNKISSANGDILIESQYMYPALGRIQGSGLFDLRIIVNTTLGLSIILAGPKMPSAPVLELFTDPIP